MRDPQFDAWTRRRLSLAMGALAAVTGLAAPEVADARKRKRKRKHKKRCRKVGQGCTVDGKHRCCKSILCARVTATGRLCCKDTGTPCSVGTDCCSNLCFAGRCQIT